MLVQISKGQVFLDKEGDEFDEVEVVKVHENCVVFRYADNELVVVDIETVIQDLASGYLIHPFEASA